MADRVVLYVDYQNVYRGAREAFHRHHAPSRFGQIDPVRLGELLVSRGPFDRQLSQVRIYRGIPSSTRDPKGYAASQRQIAEWSKSPKVQVFQRPLKYPPRWPEEKPKEKGVDVSLAVDLVRMAYQDQFDVAIVMSTDTDFLPALETVAPLPHCRVEVAAWSSTYTRCRRLHLSGRNVWCHWLDEDDYRLVQDTCDYNAPKPFRFSDPAVAASSSGAM